MPRIEIRNWSQKTVEVTDVSRSLLQHLHDHRLDWMHACGGKGRCTTCKAIVVQGIGNFGPLTQAEQKYRQLGALKDSERLSCQTQITGDVTIAVPEEYKFPHIRYDSE